MPVLIVNVPDGRRVEVAFRGDLRIGSAAGNELRLSPELGAAPRHAVITRSEPLQLPLLFDLAGAEQTRVNRRPVIRLKTLRHGDEIEVGRLHMQYWELIARPTTPQSPFLGNECPVCNAPFQIGDETIACPRCLAPHHLRCWLRLEYCSREGCVYPARETIERAIAPLVAVEVLEKTGDPVAKSWRCPAGNDVDTVPFFEGQHVCVCPKCTNYYHLSCWLTRSTCDCGFDVAALLRQLLVPGALAAETT